MSSYIDPLISVIIPVYNSEKYLDDCLKSVVNQTYKNLEIIIIDDGSKDKSKEIYERYKKNDSRVITKYKNNSGSSEARNYGLDICKGEYILFLDSDDWIDLNTCEIAINEIIKENYQVVMWGYVREFSEKSIIRNIYEKDIIFDNNACFELYRKLFGPIGEELANPEKVDVLCPSCMKLYDAKLIKDENIRFKDIKNIGTYEDGLFNIEVFKNVRSAKFINKNFYHYRKTNKNSITTKYKHDFLIKWKNLFNLMNNIIKHEKLDEKFKIALNNRIAISTLGLGLNIVNSELHINEKLRCIKEIIYDDMIHESYKNFNLNTLSIKWKLFYLLCKNKRYKPVYLTLIIINSMRGRI